MAYLTNKHFHKYYTNKKTIKLAEFLKNLPINKLLYFLNEFKDISKYSGPIYITNIYCHQHKHIFNIFSLNINHPYLKYRDMSFIIEGDGLLIKYMIMSMSKEKPHYIMPRRIFKLNVSWKLLEYL